MNIRCLEMKSSVAGQKLKYLLHLPEKADEPERKIPVLLFLHGAGERGDDLKKVKIHGPFKLIDKMSVLRDMIIVGPQCPTDEWWQPETLKALLEEVLDAHPEADKKRLYLTGLSMGGYGSWHLIATYPSLFAAAVPICGGGDPLRLSINREAGVQSLFDEQDLKKARTLPVWAFHGEKDPVVPVEEARRVLKILREAGSDANLTVYAGVEHDSWTQTYENVAVYDWLSSHVRHSTPEA